ncbi:glycerophosphoryl diester phosphodiesterase [Caldalkalibacillus thermarum TA2.A1]|uniref:Glycerophosphoryl diester phosphodiesterase n=1 Tax=Caldalkalibacillus thermarum (strain TA2.A1) TaxID=986075 RepID=F5L501_CALTT|nr:glycerophosphodiester phosphodiesterase [Caldalkalibacillus thermarum]EGL83577.1 glycerophosphoryl diester phosphodiesterase [Caldalkalibacillus thermarum TA2.A1]
METRIHHAPTPYLRAQRKKKKPIFKIIISVFFLLVLAYLILFLIVVPERPDYPFFEGDKKPLVIAHRGGAALAPENTLLAFEQALELGVDVIEFDAHMTRDGHLVVIHDETVDRTTDGEGRVDALTLDQIKALDAAYTFRDIRGNYIFRNQGVTIPTVEEVFKAFPSARMLIELKYAEPDEESPGYFPGVIGAGETVKQVMARKLWELIEAYNMEDQVLVASFDDEILSYFQSYAQGRVPIVAGQQEAIRFAFYHKTFLSRLYRPQADVMSLPPEHNFFNLTDQRLINGAKKLNMPIFYWTINEEEVIRDLLLKGVDGIITDRPDLLIRVMNEMEEFNGNH